MHLDILWDKTKSGRTHLTGLGPEERDNVLGADRSYPLASGRIFADRGGGWSPVLQHAEEDVDALSDWEIRWGIRTETRDGINSDVILLVFQGEDNMSGILEALNWGVGWEELVPDEEHESQEGPELECPAVACVLAVFAGPEAEVEAQLDQVINVAFF